MSRKFWRGIKGRMKFKGIGCCGLSWHNRISDISLKENEEEGDEDIQALMEEAQEQGPRIGHMSLAMALEFDRHLLKIGSKRNHKPLMRLFEESDDPDHAATELLYYNYDRGVDGLCCVCMERNRDAAFISCGHTYCRPCSKDLWSNRGSCPLCNGRIDDILDIY